MRYSTKTFNFQHMLLGNTLLHIKPSGFEQIDTTLDPHSTMIIDIQKAIYLQGAINQNHGDSGA